MSVGVLNVRVLWKSRLRRSQCDGLNPASFFVGVKVSISGVEANQHPSRSKSRPSAVAKQGRRVSSNHAQEHAPNRERFPTTNTGLPLRPLDALRALLALDALKTLRSVLPVRTGWPLCPISPR
jgi:hypothetical protein